MTNTLHRQGTRESLSRDFVVFLTSARGINREGCAEQMRRFMDMAMEEKPNNIGINGKNLYTADPAEMRASLTDNTHVSATFSDPEAVRRLVAKLKAANLGISANISGPAKEVDEILRSQGIVRHSIEHSLGVMGSADRLPGRQILEISTMCGHGLVSHNHTKKMIDWVKGGKVKPRQAARYLARCCACGVFNVDRAEELLAKAAETE